MAKIRVFIADDHAVLRAGLRLLLNTQPDLEVVGDAGDLVATRDGVAFCQPDVLTLDLSMPGGNPLRLIEALRQSQPSLRVLVLTMHDDPAQYRLAVAAGAAGYVVKAAADDELLTAIRTVHAGRPYACVALNQVADLAGSHDRSALAGLSAREREVLQSVAQGHTSQAIADRLYLSVKTIESYRARVMAKLGLQNRAELTQFALSMGLLDSNTPPA
jgi:two-component system response regulator NreC